MLGRDKIKHFAAGMLISQSAFWLPWWWAFFLVFLAGAGKELFWDWFLGRGTPEWLDFWATLAGGLAGLSVQAVF